MEEYLSDRQLFREAGDIALEKGLFKEAYDWYEKAEYKLGTRWVLKKSQEDLEFQRLLANNANLIWTHYKNIRVPFNEIGNKKVKPELGKFCAN